MISNGQEMGTLGYLTQILLVNVSSYYQALAVLLG